MPHHRSSNRLPHYSLVLISPSLDIKQKLLYKDGTKTQATGKTRRCTLVVAEIVKEIEMLLARFATGLLPLAMVIGSTPALAAPNWVDATPRLILDKSYSRLILNTNDRVSVDLNSIRWVSTGVYQYRYRLGSLTTSTTIYQNYYAYERADCAYKRTASIHRVSKDERMFIHWASVAKLIDNYATLRVDVHPSEVRIFNIVCNHVQSNFQKGIVPPKLEPDWDLQPESYIEADKVIQRWP